jgi:CBS domain-containing protein
MKPTEFAAGDLMTQNPTSLSPREPIRRAFEELELSHIHHLPVVDDEGCLVGVVSQRDLLSAGAGSDKTLGEIMVTDVKTLPPTAPAREAAYLILRHAIGCVPICEPGGKLVGIVTDSDFVRVAYALLGGRVPVDELVMEEREAENL